MSLVVGSNGLCQFQIRTPGSSYGSNRKQSHKQKIDLYLMVIIKTILLGGVIDANVLGR